jgi:histidinol-phosphate aminotransferase
VAASFSAGGRRAFDTPTNFVVAELASEAEAAALCAFLARDGIGVKHLFDYELPSCVRITIGPMPAMERLVESVRRFFGAGR